jgi:hypothetical protein
VESHYVRVLDGHSTQDSVNDDNAGIVPIILYRIPCSQPEQPCLDSFDFTSQTDRAETLECVFQYTPTPFCLLFSCRLFSCSPSRLLWCFRRILAWSAARQSGPFLRLHDSLHPTKGTAFAQPDYQLHPGATGIGPELSPRNPFVLSSQRNLLFQDKELMAAEDFD